jgi:hypothetical protein
MTPFLFKRVLPFFLILFVGCMNLSQKKNRQEDKNRDSFVDSLWIEYLVAMETKNLAYLVKNSFDTIQCNDCLHENRNQNDYYNSKMIFNNYLNQLMHLKSIRSQAFSTYRDDSLIRISYKIEWELAPEGAYGLVYTFKKKKGHFLFSGMFFVP